ncbi:MAG: hypothetical protein RL660_1535 [Bacteroidota bacterium]|jgi:outer membrane cobalamin receptor
MPKKFRFLLAAILSFFATSAFAQLGSVKGFVYDKVTGEPVVGAQVSLQVEGKVANTDANGFYNIPRVTPGDYTMEISFVGYNAQTVAVTIVAGDIVSQVIRLEKKKTQIGEISVSRKKSEKITDTRVGVNRITTKEIKALPSVGGEPDIAQYLQVMPGVTFTGDQGGQLYIRGGSPVQNKILLDGMTIYNPFHSIGLFSVFETDAIRNAEVMSGAFSAEYGDRTSAIVNITTKDGNKTETHGKAGFSPILAKAFVEGPLIKAKDDREISLSYVASAKYSYLDRVAPIYKGLGESYKQGLPFTFADLYGKLSLNTGSGGKFNVFGFNFTDGVNYPATQLAWKNYGVGSNFVISPSSSSSLITGGVNISNYNIGLTESDNRPRQSSIGGFDAHVAVTNFFEGTQEFKYGVEVVGFSTKYEYYNYLGIRSNQDENTTQLGGFLKWKGNIKNKLIYEPGIRIQYYSTLGIFSPEPRIAAKYNFSKNFRIKAAAGRYSQNLISNKSDKDIVNLFTGFLTGPEQELEKLRTDANGNPILNNNNVQYANHLVGGIEYDNGNLELTLEPWIKDFRQLIAFNRYKTTLSQPDFIIERGMAQGVDVTAKYSKKQFYIWSVFSLGKITRSDKFQTYPPPFDRRININLVGTYTWGRKNDWELGARFNYGSAFPFTRTQAIYESIDFSQNGIGTNYLQQNGTLSLLYDTEINAGRLSDYHRLDVSLKKRLDLVGSVTGDITVGATNAYDRQNIFYINRITNNRQYQLPFFPTVAFNVQF